MAFNNIYFHLAQHRLVFDVPDLDGVDVVYCGQCYPEPTLDNKPRLALVEIDIYTTHVS